MCSFFGLDVVVLSGTILFWVGIVVFSSVVILFGELVASLDCMVSTVEFDVLDNRK